MLCPVRGRADQASLPGNLRCFCTRYGSPIVKRYRDRPDLLRVRHGTLDTDPKVEVKAHIFLREEAPWAQVPPGVVRVE